MSLDPELRATFQQTVSLLVQAGKDKYGAPTFEAPIEVAARVERKNRLVRSMEGSEVVSSATVYFADAISVKHHDRVLLPDGSRGDIISIEEVPDERGDLYYTALYLGE